MTNSNTKEKKSFIKELIFMFLDDARGDFFEDNELLKVKEIIADSYFDNLEVITKVARSEKYRTRLGSIKLISNIINQLPKKINEELKVSDYIQEFSILDKFEREYFDNLSFVNSLTIILEIIKKTHPKYVKLKEIEAKKEYIELYTLVYSLFKITVENVSLASDNSRIYQNLYNQVKANFSEQTYRHADIYFKYLHLFLSNLKNILNKNDINTSIIQFLNNGSSGAQRIKSIIEGTTHFEIFFKNSAFKTTILNRAKTDLKFMEVYYNDFGDEERQGLICGWIPVNGNHNPNQLEQVLEKIEYSIPKMDDFAGKVLGSASRTNNLSEKEKLYEIFNNLEVSEEYDFSSYSQLIISNICTTDVNLHNLGIKQYTSHSEHIVKHNLKIKCGNFLKSTLLVNVPQYHQQIKNIFTSDFGVEKSFINTALQDNPNIISSIVNYLVRSKDSEFFKLLKPILTKQNYLTISKSFLNNAASQIRNNKVLLDGYREILEMLMTKYYSDLKVEKDNFIANYRINYKGEEDELINKMESK